jgi:hypothetical protein
MIVPRIFVRMLGTLKVQGLRPHGIGHRHVEHLPVEPHWHGLTGYRRGQRFETIVGVISETGGFAASGVVALVDE